jgi:hypothetical protein
MNNFGKIKTKILAKLTESYSSNNKNEMKEVLKTIKENKDFKEMYLFYEEIENKHFEDKEVAKLYVEELSNVLKNKSKNITEFCNSLDKKLGKIEINENDLYTTVDQLLEDDNLNNIDKKVLAKKKLVDHLLKKKEIKETKNSQYSANENLLHAVLANNFNVLYNNTLNENQKEELKNILSLSNEDLEIKTRELKEDILSKVESMISESKENEFINKLTNVKTEVTSIKPSKLNYFRLSELKNGLN